VLCAAPFTASAQMHDKVPSAREARAADFLYRCEQETGNDRLPCLSQYRWLYPDVAGNAAPTTGTMHDRMQSDVRAPTTGKDRMESKGTMESPGPKTKPVSRVDPPLRFVVAARPYAFLEDYNP
jgi:hypothetical protein